MSFHNNRKCINRCGGSTGVGPRGLKPAARWVVTLTVVITGLLAVSTVAQIKKNDLTTDHIDRLITQLGDPAYAARAEATRELCMIGMPAAKALERASVGEEMEVSLRAKQILTTFERVWFSGVWVSLSFSQRQLSWDHPIDVEITFHNQSQFPAKVPFTVESESRRPLLDDARQVGDMLDLSEYLTVRSVAGQEIELRVDDISLDASVSAVVQQRLNGGPIGIIAPGTQVKLLVHGFNRGWARYPLLDEGAYTVTFDYTPAWEDEVLHAKRHGRVRTEPITLTVTQGAPATVSRHGVEASVDIARVGDDFVATLTNRTDQTIKTNTNFGPSTPFATGTWVCERSNDRRELPTFDKSGMVMSDFQAARLVTIKPGATATIARASMDSIRRGLVEAGGGGNDAWEVRFLYANQCSRRWQARQRDIPASKLPKILTSPLPRRLLTGRHYSQPLTLEIAD